MDSRNLDKSQTRYAKTTVYRDPYYSLKKAAELFRQSPITAAYVRRLWFDGFYALETSAIMFKILRLCCNLKIVTLPWTALRYGSADDWSQLLGRGRERRHITSLELLAVDLKASQINDIANQVDRKALNSSSINFSSLKRLKIFGSTNFMPITDEDMVGISRTATNLEELHVTGTSSLTIKGIMAAAQASKSTLRTLEYSPLSADGFVHPDPANYDPKNHCCHMLLQCQQLRDLSISLPSICPDIFRHLPLHWRGVVQIRAGGLHGFYTDPKDSTEGFQQFWNTIKEAQALMESRLKDNIQLDIELFISKSPIMFDIAQTDCSTDQWIFEPRFSRVHGNIEIGELLSDGLWPISKTSSCKGPRGHTSTYGKEDRPYSCISEESFRKGLRHSYISF